MKHLKSFEQHSNESHQSPLSAEEQIEILNRYTRKPIVNYESSPKGLIIKQDVSFVADKVDFESLSELNLNLYKIEGYFQLNRTHMGIKKLKDLKGFPEIVTDTLEVSSNDLQTLEGCPKVIGKKIFCSFNRNLKSLKGICQDIKTLILNRCTSLTSLEGIGKVDRLFLIETVTDLSPLEGTHSVEVIVTDTDKKNIKNAPKNVTILNTQDFELQHRRSLGEQP